MPDVSQTSLPDIDQIAPNIAPEPHEDYPLLRTPHPGPRELPHSLLSRTFRRRWQLMLVVFCILVIVGPLLSIIFVHPVYQAIAQIRFVPRPVVDSILTAADARAGYSGYLNSELSRISGRQIVELAAAKLGLSSPADVNDLLARTTTIAQERGQIVSVVVRASSPAGLVTAANAIAEAYIARDILPQIEQHQKDTQQLRDQLTAFRQERLDLSESLAGRDTQDYIRARDRRRSAYLEPLSEARRAVEAAEADYSQAAARLAALKASPADADKVQALVKELAKDDPPLEMYREIYRTIIATSDQEKLFSVSEKPLPSPGSSDSPSRENGEKAGSDASNSPAAHRQATIVQQIRQGMTERLAELKAQALEQASSGRRAQIASAESLVDHKDLSRKEKDKALQALLSEDAAVAQEITEIIQLSGKVDKLDEAIEAHVEDLREMAAELLPPAEPLLNEPATVAEKASDLRLFFIVGSVFMAALLALGTGSLVEHYDSRLTHAGDIVRRVGVPVLASLPGSDDSQAHDDLWLPQEISMVDYVNDQYRNIRTALLFGQGTPPRSIVLTAPTAAETKTTLSVNLAISMARAGRSVLLVDADLDNPTLADVFDIPESPGWSDVLRDPGSLSQAVCRTRVERLSVMPAGSQLEHYAELLSSPSCRALLDSMAQRFEHIIIDAPALLDCPEGRIIAALADGVICSFSARSTRCGQARRATAILEELGAAVIGSVLNT